MIERERLLQLIHGHLEHTLSEEERRELEAILDKDEGARKELVLASTLNQELYTLHESVPQEAAPPATRRRTRRAGPGENPAPWGVAFAAAAIFAVILIVLVTSGNVTSPPPRDTVRGGPTEEQLRRDAERRLAEIERRRLALEQTRTPGTEKVELTNLEEEKRKIEEELNAAIAEARRKGERNPPAPAPDRAPTPAPPTPPTTVVKEPTTTTVTSVARIERVEGEGWIVRKGGKTPAREGMEVQNGEGLETGTGVSRLAIRFSDRTRVELRSETAVSEVSEGAGASKQLQMASGGIVAEVVKQPIGRPMMLRTPHAEGTVFGTTLRLLVEPGEKGASRVEVQEGRVRFARLPEKKETVEVLTGHYAVAAAGSALSPRPLLPERVGTAAAPVVVSLTLLNADTGRPILQFAPLEDGRTITLADLPTRNLNIVAMTSPPGVGCVIFSWDGVAMPEVNRPYFMAGNDAAGKPKAWTPGAGEHVLTATPFTGPANMVRREGTGTAGAGLTVRLRVR